MIEKLVLDKCDLDVAKATILKVFAERSIREEYLDPDWQGILRRFWPEREGVEDWSVLGNALNAIERYRKE